MNSVLLAVGLFIPSLLGVESDEKEDVPEVCSIIEDKESSNIKVKDDLIGLVSSDTVAYCETKLINNELERLNSKVIDIKDDKEEISNKLIKEKEKQDKLEKVILEQEAKIKESQKELDRVNQELESSKVKKKEEAEEVKVDEPQNKPSKKEPKEVEEVKATETASNTPITSSTGGQTYQATYYTMHCTGCSGVTASGLQLTEGQTTHNGMRVVAVDPSNIPLNSILEINDGNSTYKAVAKDTGGDIKGNRIDILSGSQSDALSKGRHDVSVKIIQRG